MKIVVGQRSCLVDIAVLCFFARGVSEVSGSRLVSLGKAIFLYAVLFDWKFYIKFCRLDVLQIKSFENNPVYSSTIIMTDINFQLFCGKYILQSNIFKEYRSSF